jgi:hypothetical protein
VIKVATTLCMKTWTHHITKILRALLLLRSVGDICFVSSHGTGAVFVGSGSFFYIQITVSIMLITIPNIPNTMGVEL